MLQLRVNQTPIKVSDSLRCTEGWSHLEVEQQVEARADRSLLQAEGAAAEPDNAAGEKGHGPDSDKMVLLNNSDRPDL